MGNLTKLNFYFFIFIFYWLKSIISFFFIYSRQSDIFLNKKSFSKILKINFFYYKIFKIKITYLLKSKTYYFIDYIYIYIYSYIFKNNLNFNFFFINYKLNQTLTFYFDKIHNSIYKKTLGLNFSIFLGLKYFWILIRYWVLGLLLFIFFFYYLTYIRLLPFNKVIFEWFLISMFIYWLISGFVYFIKKYQYSKYTSVIQRFWKRSFIIFWIIEGYLFFVYFYLTLNASEEPVFMYDQMKLYKTHLFSWRLFILKIIPIISMVVLTNYLQLSLKWSLFNKQSIFILLITVLMLYILWLEFYQFFHILSFYGNLNWIFDYDEFLWNLELEFKRTRLSNNYLALCLIAKFWHLIFIFIFWLFFVLRVNEITRIRYSLLAANYQNFLLLYVLSWLYMYPWFKLILRNFLDTPYYWLMLNNRSLVLRVFLNDFKIFVNITIYKIYTIFINFKVYYFTQFSFYYWYESSKILGYNQFKKHFLRDYIIFFFNL